MKRLVYASLAFLSVFTLAAYSGHKEEAKVPEVKVEQKQAKFDEKLFKEAGILSFKSEKQLELGELDSKNRATGAHIQLKDSDEPTEKREPKISYNPVGWHNYIFYYGDGSKKAWLMNRGHLIGYQFSGLNDEKKNLVPMTNWLNAGTYYGTDNTNQESILYYENRLDSWLANHPNYYLDYKVTPIYQKDELSPRQIDLQSVGIDEKVDKYSVTHVILDNVSANAEINYLDGTAKNTVENEEEKSKKEAEEKAKKEAEEKAKKEAEEKAEAEKKAKEEEEKARQAEQEKEESQESNTQSAKSGGYFKDSIGRWHKPNGKFASKKEIIAAGLQW